MWKNVLCPSEGSGSEQDFLSYGTEPMRNIPVLSFEEVKRATPLLTNRRKSSGFPLHWEWH